MADHATNTPAAGPQRGYLEHAQYRARAGRSGVGAAVIRSSWAAGEHRWDVIVSDGTEHHYIYIVGTLGPRPNISSYAVEEAVERYAGTLPEGSRLRAFAASSRLRIDGAGRVSR